jgi:hypothetical protein
MQAIERNMTIPERLQLSDRLIVRSDKELRGLFSYSPQAKSRFTTGDNLMPGKIIDLLEDNDVLGSPDFQDWQMPKQAAGYIKSKKHDFL